VTKQKKITMDISNREKWTIGNFLFVPLLLLSDVAKSERGLKDNLLIRLGCFCVLLFPVAEELRVGFVALSVSSTAASLTLLLVEEEGAAIDEGAGDEKEEVALCLCVEGD